MSSKQDIGATGGLSVKTDSKRDSDYLHRLISKYRDSTSLDEGMLDVSEEEVKFDKGKITPSKKSYELYGGDSLEYNRTPREDIQERSVPRLRDERDRYALPSLHSRDLLTRTEDAIGSKSSVFGLSRENDFLEKHNLGMRYNMRPTSETRELSVKTKKENEKGSPEYYQKLVNDLSTIQRELFGTENSQSKSAYRSPRQTSGLNRERKKRERKQENYDRGVKPRRLVEGDFAKRTRCGRAVKVPLKYSP
ncbi:unnamed protein product [Mytilus edulis]|uniref:Uncharacterized protein n=1 Tax=Mytilus edulis TaxID=6550 RepID=A0A8S3V6K3_MYTED|nr:unnamed protein product [Mytilus edulis]